MRPIVPVYLHDREAELGEPWHITDLPVLCCGFKKQVFAVCRLYSVLWSVVYRSFSSPSRSVPSQSLRRKVTRHSPCTSYPSFLVSFSPRRGLLLQHLYQQLQLQGAPSALDIQGDNADNAKAPALVWRRTTILPNKVIAARSAQLVSNPHCSFGCFPSLALDPPIHSTIQISVALRTLLIDQGADIK